MPFLRQSTIQTIRFGPFLDATDGVTEEIALTITQALRRLSKDGGAFAQTGTTGNATHDSDGWYSANLSAADTNTVGELILNVQAPATHLPVWMRWWVIEEVVYDSIYGAAAAGPLQSTVAARTLDVTATGAAGIDWGNVENKTTVNDLSATDIRLVDTCTTNTDMVAAAPTSAAIADAVLNEDMTAHQTTGSLGQAIGDPVANTKTLYAALVTDAVGASVTADVATVQSDTDNLQTRIPSALVSGRMDSSVGAMAANVITATSINAAALTAAKFGAGAIDANALATDAVNEIRDAIMPPINVAFPDIEFLFVAASDHNTVVTAATGTAVTRSIDGSAFGAGTGTLAEVGNGIYQYDASAADMNGKIITFRFTATGGTPSVPSDRFMTIVTGG